MIDKDKHNGACSTCVFCCDNCDIEKCKKGGYSELQKTACLESRPCVICIPGNKQFSKWELFVPSKR